MGIYSTISLWLNLFVMTCRLYTPVLLVLSSCLLLGVCDDKKNGLIIDTDAGPEDALAIMMLLEPSSPYKVLAITCVSGNTNVNEVAKNVLTTLKFLVRTEIPVYLGPTQGFSSTQTSDFIYGKDGFGDLNSIYRPNLNNVPDMPAALAIVDLIKSNCDDVTLLFLGPLTNLALALHIYPALLSCIHVLMISGGSYDSANIYRTTSIEFNMFMDSRAAAFVFANVPEDAENVYLISLETVYSCKKTMDWRKTFTLMFDTRTVKFLDYVERTLINESKMKDWMPSGALAAALLMNDEIQQEQQTKASITVDTYKENEGRMSVQFNTGGVTIIHSNVDTFYSDLLQFLSK